MELLVHVGAALGPADDGEEHRGRQEVAAHHGREHEPLHGCCGGGEPGAGGGPGLGGRPGELGGRRTDGLTAAVPRLGSSKDPTALSKDLWLCLL